MEPLLKCIWWNLTLVNDLSVKNERKFLTFKRVCVCSRAFMLWIYVCITYACYFLVWACLCASEMLHHGCLYIEILFSFTFKITDMLQLVGGEFDIENNFIIQNPKNILHMLKLLEVCPHTLQVILMKTHNIHHYHCCHHHSVQYYYQKY